MENADHVGVAKKGSLFQHAVSDCIVMLQHPAPALPSLVLEMVGSSTVKTTA